MLVLRSSSAVRCRFQAILLLLALTTPSVSALPHPREPWLELTTPHFVLYGNSSRGMMQQFARDLEQLHAALGQFSRFDLEARVPTHVYVFYKDSKFNPYKPLHNGRPKDVGGYFLGTPDGNYIALNGDPAADPTSIVYHEYVHYVLANNYSRLPAWLEEGTAEFFSTFRIDRGQGGSDQAIIGRAIPEHVFWLRRNSLIPLPELMAITVDSPDYNEGRRRGVFYAQSWALVHYLMVGEEQRLPQLNRYLHLTSDGTDPTEAFTVAFDAAPNELEKELLAYVRGNTFRFGREPIENADESVLKPRPMARHEVLYRLGDLLAHHRDREDDATEHFRAALALEPEHAPSLAGLGHVAELAGRLSEAREHYKRSLAADPDQPRVLFRYAETLTLQKDTAESRQLALESLERATDLDPQFVPPWASLVYLYAFDSQPTQDVVARAEKAQSLLPTRDDVAFNLLSIYGAAGRLESARALMKEFFVPHGDPVLLERAQHLVDGIAHNRFVEIYNRAVRLFNSMRYREAREILEELLESLSDGSPQVNQARELLESVRIELERRGG